MSIEGPQNIKSAEESLEEKYNKREKIEIPGGKAEILDIEPDNAKGKTPVLFAPGYGSGSPTGMKANIFEMVKQGRRIIMVESPHGVPHEIKDKKAKGMQETFLRQIAALIPALEKKGIEKINVVCQSEGCIYAILAAYLYPEKFKNIVLINPGGMIGEDKTAKLTFRFIKEMLAGAVDILKRKKTLSPLVQEQMKHGPAEFIQYLWSNKKTAVKEISDIANAQIHDLLKGIKDEGIGIIIIHGVKDRVFPMKEIQKQTKAPMVDGFYSVKGGHGEFLINAEKYTRVAEEALSALEEKQKLAAIKENK